MEIKVWVLSTCSPESNRPHLPQVFGSEMAALDAFEEAMRGEWIAVVPYDDDGNELPYPGNAYEAHDRMSKWIGWEWGRWEITAHTIDVPFSVELAS